MKLKDKVALITGGTKGIGAAAAVELARRGADVAINGRHDNEEGRGVKAKITALGRKCAIVVGDMGKREDCERIIDETDARLGGLDILVHSAGGNAPGSLTEVSPEAWLAAFDVHVHAAFYLCRKAVPLMRPKGEGAIVLVSSVAGIRGCPDIAAYGTVKGTVLQMTRMFARDLADDNIRVNCLSPGIIRTDFHKDMTEERKRLNLDHRIPLHREGTAEQCGQAIAFLAENDYTTGENLVVDGGLTSRIA